MPGDVVPDPPPDRSRAAKARHVDQPPKNPAGVAGAGLRFVDHPDTFTIADIRKALPGVRDNTIRLVLTALKGARRITNDGTGRSARWRRTEVDATR